MELSDAIVKVEILLAVTLILQSGTYFGFTLSWLSIRKSSTEPPNIEYTFCIDCKHLEAKDAVLSSLVDNFRRPDDQRKCCNTTSAILDLIIQQEQILLTQDIITTEAEDQVNLAIANCSVISPSRIHGRLKHISGSVRHDSVYKLTWIASDHQPEHMTHHENEGELVVLTPGEYFVTSHIIYQGQKVDLDEREFGHSVVHCKEGTDDCKVVLQDSKGSCIGGEGFEFTSTVSGLVHVEKNNRLFVSSSHNESFIDKQNCYLSLHHSYS